MENWKTYKEIPRYEVSDKGRVRNAVTGRLMKTSIDRQGYERITVTVDGLPKNLRIHRMVAETFSFREHPNMCVRHRDDNRSNNNFDNLYWCTRREISKSGYERGVRHAHNRRRIRCIETGEEFNSIFEASKYLGISAQSISSSLNNRTMQTKDGYHFEYIY